MLGGADERDPLQLGDCGLLMWLRLLRAAVRRARGGFIMMLVATALGCALVSALLAVSLGVQDKISRELNHYGANIRVLPASGHEALSEADV